MDALGPASLPLGTLVVRLSETDADATAFYEAKWRASLDRRQMKRRIGRAWLERDAAGAWRPRRGRVREGFLDERRAIVAMADAIATCEADDRARRAERLRERASFRQLASTWLRYLEKVKRVKPSTLRDYQFMLAEPGTSHRRGGTVATGLVMAELGDLSVGEIQVADVERLLDLVEERGVAPRTVNKHRQVLCAIFNFAMLPTSRFAVTHNPAISAAKRREPPRRRIDVYTVEQIETLGRTAACGSWRTPRDEQREDATLAALQDENDQLSALLQVAAYTGLRRGELVALRWRNVNWDDRVLAVEAAVSANVETTPKSGHFRDVPLAAQALDALRRLASRDSFTAPDDYVFCNAAGDRLDPSALRRRYVAVRDAAGLPPLRFHDLRHTAGSLLVRQLDPVSVKDILGHANLKTTERYLHAQRASALADAATRAFTPAVAPEPEDPREALKALLDELSADEARALLDERAAA